MTEKPVNAAGYTDEQVELVRSTCLYVATKLGDCMEDIIIVGGLVPSLLINQNNLPEGVEKHVGTMDLDIGLNLAIFESSRYQTIVERLRRANFIQDVNDQGNPTRQRWKIDGIAKVTVDFLIPPVETNDKGGTIKDLEKDFAAVITPGLNLAFTDRQKVSLSGSTIMGEKAKRDVWVCGPGAFVVLKALAFRERGENKDAYDLFYNIRNFGNGVQDVADALKPLLNYPEAEKAIEILKEDFFENTSLGPIRVSLFLTNSSNEDIQADVVGFVRQLIELCN